MATEHDAELADVADDLYAVPPSQFVAARNVRAKAADRALAGAIAALRRPAPAAWIVNLLARERRDELERLLELGAVLREAHAALDRAEITRLAKERRAVGSTLARAGGQLAADAGHRVSPAVIDTVAATLDAGLADPEAAAAIRSGRLLRPLETIGFEPVDLAEAVALPEAGSRAAEKRATPTRQAPRAVDDTDAELARARARADAAVERAETDETGAAHELDETETRLRVARTALAAAQREADAAERARDAATAAHEKAGITLDAARRARRNLG